MSTIISQSQCPACAAQGKDTAGDNLCEYENGYHCHACGHNEFKDGAVRKEQPVLAGNLLQKGSYEAIPSRKLTADTCRKYGIKTQNGHAIFEERDVHGNVCSQKIKNLSTGAISIRGDHSSAVLQGRHLFKAGGKRIIVCEGEFDAPSAYQTLSAKSAWPVVSIIGGADAGEGAAKVVNEIKKNYEYLNSFEEVVICFDNDSAGKNSADAVVGLFPPGKAFVTKLTFNDPSEYLQQNKSQELYKDLWASPAWRPDGIVSIADVDTNFDIGEVLLYKSKVMTAKMLGRKKGTMTMVVSGTGSGKTTWVREEMEADVECGISVGGIFLEEAPRDTLLELAGMQMGVPVRRILTQRALSKLDPDLPVEFADIMEDDELEATIKDVKGKQIHLYDHFGSAKASDILSNIEYMVTGLGCEAIYLDHLSLVQVDGDDIKGLEGFVKQLQALTKRLPAHFFIISQASQGDGKKSHEEGGKMTVRHIRGSQMIPACMDEIISLTRDQQADDEDERNLVSVHSLKGRLGAHTGFIESRRYDKQSGRLLFSDDPFKLEQPAPDVEEPNFDTENIV